MSNNFVDLELASASENSLSTKDAQHQWEWIDTEAGWLLEGVKQNVPWVWWLDIETYFS